MILDRLLYAFVPSRDHIPGNVWYGFEGKRFPILPSEMRATNSSYMFQLLQGQQVILK
jgi:hypothetical protein